MLTRWVLSRSVERHAESLDDPDTVLMKLADAVLPELRAHGYAHVILGEDGYPCGGGQPVLGVKYDDSTDVALVWFLFERDSYMLDHYNADGEAVMRVSDRGAPGAEAGWDGHGWQSVNEPRWNESA